MKKALPVFFLCLIFLGACAHGHGSAGTHIMATMYYAYPLDSLFSASKTVLMEQGFDITEINRAGKLIKAKKSGQLPLKRIIVTFTFREEGNGTWLEIDKDVPPQFIPGSTAGYRMDLDDLFRYVDSELERNY